MTEGEDVGAQAPDHVRTPRRNSAFFVVGLLTLVYVVNFLDRQIVNILAEPIKVDLGLSDVQIGLMTGVAFALVHTLLAIPGARLAERTHRPRLLAISMAIWSFFTLTSAFARGFTTLALFRLGVGIGESTCAPTAHALIADSVPADKRASALGIYALGIPLGTLLGMSIGGIVADAWGWRTAFLVAGAPGLLLVPVLWFYLEEPRPAHDSAKKSVPTLSQTLKLFGKKPAFYWICLGTGIFSFVAYGHTAFLGSFLLRSHAAGMTDLLATFNALTGAQLGLHGAIGVALGVALGLSGGVGTLVGGRVSDRLIRRDPRAYALIPGLVFLLSVPMYLGALWTGSAGLALSLIAASQIVTSSAYGAMFASVQSLVSVDSRATASAVLLVSTGLLGPGLGPLAVGLVSDFLGAWGWNGGEALRWSLIGWEFAMVAAFLCFIRAARTFRQDMAG